MTPPGPAPPELPLPEPPPPARTFLGRVARSLGPVAIVLFLAWLGGRATLDRRLLYGHDALAWVPRLVELHENLRDGIVPPRWAPDLAAGNGLPLFVVSPILFLSVGEVFYASGVPLFLSHNLALFTFYLAAGLGLYLGARSLVGRWGAATAAAAYLFAPYVHVDLYVRQAAAELSGLACLPPLLAGAVALARGRMRAGGTLLVLGTTLGGLAHGTTYVMAPVTAVVLAAAAAAGTRSKRPLEIGLAAAGAGLVLSAFSWLPAIVESKDLSLERLRTGYWHYDAHFVELPELVSQRWGFGSSWPGPDDGLSLSVGIVQVVLAGAGLVRAIRSREPVERAMAIALAALALGAIALATRVSGPVWELLPLLQTFQFPWRFLALAAFALAALAGFAVRDWPLLAVLAVALLLFFNLDHARAHHTLDDEVEGHYLPEALARAGTEVGWAQEFLPRDVEEIPRYAEMDIRSGALGITTDRRADRRRLTLAAPRDSMVTLAILAFPGWTVTVDGRAVRIEAEPVTGCIRFRFPAGSHEVEARFGRTPVRRFADTLSLGTLAGLVLGFGALTVRHRTAGHDTSGS